MYYKINYFYLLNLIYKNNYNYWNILFFNNNIYKSINYV